MSQNFLFSERSGFFAAVRWMGAFAVGLFAMGSVLESLAEPSPIRWLAAASVVFFALIALFWAVTRQPLSVPQLRVTVLLAGMYAAGAIVEALHRPSLSHTLMAVGMSIFVLSPLPLLWVRSRRRPGS